MGRGDIGMQAWEGGGAVLDRLRGHVTRLRRADKDTDWLLSDHSSIGGLLVIDEVRRADRREVVDWDRLAATLADEDEGWYRDLVGETAYDKLLDLRRRHL